MLKLFAKAWLNVCLHVLSLFAVSSLVMELFFVALTLYLMELIFGNLT